MQINHTQTTNKQYPGPRALSVRRLISAIPEGRARAWIWLALVALWGGCRFPLDPEEGDPVPPAPEKPPVVAAGANHSLVVDRNGTLWSFGQDHNGQLGRGGALPGSSVRQPTEVAQGVAGVWASGDNTLFLTVDGGLFVAGYGPWILPESGTYAVGQSAPLELVVADDQGAKQHIAWASTDGSGRVLAIDTSDRLWALGMNGTGSLGIGGDGGGTVWEATLSATDVRMVSMGFYHSVMLKRDGSVWTAGNEGAFTPPLPRLGAGDTLSSTSWIKIADDAAYVEAGTDQSLYIENDGSLWMFGSNAFGQIGPPDRFPEEVYAAPVKVAEGVTIAATEYRFTAAVYDDGRLEVWGDPENAGVHTAPGESSTARLAVGDFHLLYLAPRGSLHGLGSDLDGELLQQSSGEVSWRDLGWSPP